MSFYGTDYDEDGTELPPPGPVVRRLADVQPERVSWLWPGYLARGKLHVLDGDPGLGKSTMTLDLAARTTTGTAWPDGTAGISRSGVLLVSAEDGLADTIRPRLDAAGADVGQVYALTGIRTAADGDRPAGERMPSLPDDIDRLARLIADYDVGLVVIDPLMAYLGADINSYRDQDIRRALAPLAQAAEKTSAAIILVRHLTKGSGGANALYRGGGSIGIVGAARFGYTVGRDPEDENVRVLAASKANLAIEPPALAYRLTDVPELGCARVEWLGTVQHTAADLLRDRGDDEERAERDEAAAFVRSYLTDQGGEAVAGDVLRAGRKAGFAERTVKRARARAGAQTRRSGAIGGAWVWSLDDEEATKGPKGPIPETQAPSAPSGPLGVSDSQSGHGPDSPATHGVVAALHCRACHQPLDPRLAARGETVHPNCSPEEPS